MSDSTIYRGQHWECFCDKNGIATLYFNHSKASVNKFDKEALKDLQTAVLAIQNHQEIMGLILASRKDVFVVGADITEFKSYFKQGDQVLSSWLKETHNIFAAIEDLPYPTVTAINGVCLGGGMEFALTSCFRVASTTASLGLPETKLGIYPGWGGTIRLPRLIGADNAIEWIAGGGTYSPEDALTVGAVDAVVAPDNLMQACQNVLQQAMAGKLNWQARRQDKTQPLKLLSSIEAAMVFESAKAFVGAKAGPHYPAPMEAIQRVQAHARKSRDEAAMIEIEGFIKLAKSSVADNLVTIFLADQYNKKKSKQLASQGGDEKKAAVLGAGIMGGGIAYQAASRGVRILMKDINDKALELGLGEASKLLNQQIERKKITPEKMAETLTRITPTLSYGEFNDVGLIVEAVVENEQIKKKVFQDLENYISKTAVLASNTSTIAISRLAQGLKHPERFCGLHFFNPVPKMPLVEIIRGEKTSEETISRATAFALKIGKTPIVVNDCPGFLVNRVLFPYFFGFQSLLTDGVDFQKIDKVMEKFGWPMGPAYLLDVIGLDTAVHAGKVMSMGFPDRMAQVTPNAMSILTDANRLGQKNGKGFYAYTPDKKGKPKKTLDPQTAVLLQGLNSKKKEVSDEEIIDRMMLPMIHESSRCLEEKIVSSPMEVDIGVLYGLGFPPFRGGVLKYADDCGLKTIIEKSERFASLGAAYAPTKLLRELAQQGKRFYDAMT